MKKTAFYLAIAAILLAANQAAAQLMPVLGAQRAGTASLQFLKIGVGGRSAAMGESFVAVANDASALFWNPAGAAQADQDQAIAAHTIWLVDIQHEFLGILYHLSPEEVVGLSVTSVHMDDMPVTTELQPLGTGSYFHFGDVAAGLTYSRKLTNQFSFGITARYYDETLDVLSMRGVLLDMGTYYWTGLGTLRFSAVVTNFGSQVSPTGTEVLTGGQTLSQFQSFAPPTLFRFGFAFEPIKDESSSLTTSFQLNHPNDNSENLGIGLEYQWFNSFFLRGGYKVNVDEESFSFGVGVATTIDLLGVNLDYGYTPYKTLGSVHRISMGVRL